MKQDLLDLNLEEMKRFVTELGEKPFRGKQLFHWVQRGVVSFDEMTNLSKDFRQRLAAAARIGRLELLDVQEDRADGTRKFLFGLPEDTGLPEGVDIPDDSETPDNLDAHDDPDAPEEPDAPVYGLESVFMKYGYGNTICVSTQIGCRMGCRFCASALGGFVRNLTAGEMLAQVLGAERETGEPVNHIVLMGMGEPFDNYENVSRFLQILHDPAGRNMSWRHMTVSTSGIIPVMERFSEDFPQVNLAISLHRIDDEGRSGIMPINRRFPVGELLEAARRYTGRTGRRITFEYALIRGENDRPEDIEGLCRALQGMLCHVNLIPLNEVRETGLSGSSRQRAHEIAQRLEQAGIPATVRRELGREIDGACGQLRLRAMGR